MKTPKTLNPKKTAKARKTVTPRREPERVARKSFAPPARSPALTWRARTPKRCGWWWYRWSDQHTPQILEVFIDETDSSWSVRHGRGEDDASFLENYSGQWGWPGPLIEPQEPRHVESPENNPKLSDPRP